MELNYHVRFSIYFLFTSLKPHLSAQWGPKVFPSILSIYIPPLSSQQSNQVGLIESLQLSLDHPAKSMEDGKSSIPVH